MILFLLIYFLKEEGGTRGRGEGGGKSSRKVAAKGGLKWVMLQRLYATSSILNFRPTNFLTYCNIRPTTAVGRFHILIF